MFSFLTESTLCCSVLPQKNDSMSRIRALVWSQKPACDRLGHQVFGHPWRGIYIFVSFCLLSLCLFLFHLVLLLVCFYVSFPQFIHYMTFICQNNVIQYIMQK